MNEETFDTFETSIYITNNKKTTVMRPSCISPEIKSIIQRCIQIKYTIVLLKYDFAGPGSHRTNNRRVHIDGIYISFF